jgi:hypothetical protein
VAPNPFGAFAHFRRPCGLKKVLSCEFTNRQGQVLETRCLPQKNRCPETDFGTEPRRTWS